MVVDVIIYEQQGLSGDISEIGLEIFSRSTKKVLTVPSEEQIL